MNFKLLKRLTVLALVGVGVALATGGARSDTPAPAPPEAVKPDLTILYTINNLGFIEPCG